MALKQTTQKRTFIIIAGKDSISETPKITKESLIKERYLAFKNKDYKRWFEISKLLIDKYI